nr:hypothetical protein Iba_scaffold47343CG0020 [Ipomoea batatas]
MVRSSISVVFAVPSPPPVYLKLASELPSTATPITDHQATPLEFPATAAAISENPAAATEFLTLALELLTTPISCGDHSVAIANSELPMYVLALPERLESGQAVPTVETTSIAGSVTSLGSLHGVSTVGAQSAVESTHSPEQATTIVLLRRSHR